ncbi:MAG: hypothetical protein LBK60_08665 [Verrucomicrobiales bacterium]|nr:hypothetical protein [Verrucomicrobiales bacterium]
MPNGKVEVDFGADTVSNGVIDRTWLRCRQQPRNGAPGFQTVLLRIFIVSGFVQTGAARWDRDADRITGATLPCVKLNDFYFTGEFVII